MSDLPQKPGYYWAKAITADEFDHWEIAEVDENILGWDQLTDDENPERLSVHLCGEEKVKWRQAFVWGSFVAPLRPAEDHAIVGLIQ